MQVLSPSAADIEECAAAIRGGSKTFFAASLLLPKEIRRAAYAIYAFCRYSDDAIDTAGGDGRALQNLDRRLARLYAGDPDDHFADRAFAEVAQRHAIPEALPQALLEGFAWDVEGRRYPTLSDLEDYAARVAGAVGAIMSCLMGVRSREALARATDLGTAMQLTNIARDVGEDARAGRFYLPLDWINEAGVDPEAFIADPRFSPALGRVIARLLARAETLYDRGAAGIAFLPLDCRAAIGAARLIYAEIGAEIARRGHDSVTQRAVVPMGRKLALLAAALVGVPQNERVQRLPALTANKFLVDAAWSDAAPPPLSTFDDRIGGVIDLLSRLERRDRLDGAAFS